VPWILLTTDILLDVALFYVQFPHQLFKSLQVGQLHVDAAWLLPGRNDIHLRALDHHSRHSYAADIRHLQGDVWFHEWIGHPHRRILLIELKGSIAAIGAFALRQIDVPDVAEVVVVVAAAHLAVFGANFYGGAAADAGLAVQTDDGDGLAEVAAPGGVDEAALELTPAASFQAAADYFPDDSTPATLLALIRFPDDRGLDDFPLWPSYVLIQCSLSQAFGIVLFDSFEVLLFGLVKIGGDLLLQNAFSLAGTTGKLVLLM
jgi:hypothetical protein